MQNYGNGHVCLLPFLTHFADLSSWEYAKKLKAILPQVEAAGVQVSSSEHVRVVYHTLSLLAFMPLMRNVVRMQRTVPQMMVLRKEQMAKQGTTLDIAGDSCGTRQQAERNAFLKATRLSSPTPLRRSGS